ncbi:MAG: hypothetical protein HXY34_01130 [Candidatus Thorarchaeota archaeon]|nr:hypothetical protein [Candidatus Thorarchaeota archaeon]
MELESVQNVLTSLMILSFLIFGGLALVIQTTHTPLSPRAVALPFVFLFISIMTFVVSGSIEDNPAMLRRYLTQWLSACAFVVLFSAIVFTLA